MLEGESQNDFNINPLKEKEIWQKETIKNYTYQSVFYQSFYYNSLMYEMKKANLLNPFYCHNNRKQYKYWKNIK